MATCSPLYRFLPKRNSPKLPQPIFLPTRKFGPTIKTPELELALWRVECDSFASIIHSEIKKSSKIKTYVFDLT